MDHDASIHRLFLLSPALCSGKRAALLLRESAEFDLALRLRSAEGATLGEVFSFMSGLYFRGKLAYATAFGRPPGGLNSALVIAPGHGLLPATQRVTVTDVRAMAAVPVDLAEPRYVAPLDRDLRALQAQLHAQAEVVLLGSIATPKYCQPLHDVLGNQLRYPSEFVGRGDMSRGGLMLRAVAAGHELTYVALSAGARRGRRPPKLEPR